MFWQPVYRAVDLPSGRAIPIRIMSEDFTLYRGERPHPNPNTVHFVATRIRMAWLRDKVGLGGA